MKGRNLSRAALLSAALGLLGACGGSETEDPVGPAEELSSTEAAASTPICPGGGWYCGNDGVTYGSANVLYYCPGYGYAPSSSQTCAYGCSIQPPGYPDRCNSAPSGPICPGSGAYCGKDGVTGGQPDTLYSCPGAGRAPSSSTPCANGCSVQPPGYPDYCIAGGGGSCSAAGQTALAFEASKLATPYNYAEWCLRFVFDAYAYAGVTRSWLAGGSAAISLSYARGAAGWVPWNGSCPCGAVIYWPASSCNGSYGHVAICNGDGTASSSGWYGSYPWPGSTRAQISWLNSMECGYQPAGYILP